MRFPRPMLVAMFASASLYALAACDKDGDDGDEPSGATSSTSSSGSGTSPIGGACTTLADCVSGLAECNADPGGQCTKPCKLDSECGPDAICETGGGNCYVKCATSADCKRSGYACVGGEPGHKFCDPKHEVGGSCNSAADCADGLGACNIDPGGQCTNACTKPADCANVPGGAVCETDRPGNCYKECTSKADCERDGYDCVGGPNPEGKKWCDVVNSGGGGAGGGK